MKMIGLVVLVLGLLLVAAGLSAIWWSYQPLVTPEQPRPSDLANRISTATLIAAPAIPLGISLAIGGWAVFVGGLFSRDSKRKGAG